MSLAHLMVALTGASAALYGAMMAIFARTMGRRASRPRPTVDRAPRISILKPLAGCDDELEQNLESFARVDYPAFEILLGVATKSDPAFAAAHRFVADHPTLEAQVIVTDPRSATNPKVAQLVGLERAATGALYVISDSNVRVKPDYLWSLVRDLSDERVGLVTSLFAGTGEKTLGAALENLQICASTAPGIVALDVVGAPLCVGKSMAMRRRDLAVLGGFAPVGHVLAEDHALGRRFMDAGFVARTSLDTVENRNVACSLMQTMDRHSRWAKMRGSLYPGGFVLELLLTPIVVASFGVVVSPSKVTATVLAIVCVAQSACALLAVRLLRGHLLPWRYAPLEIVRSYTTLLCWLCACASRRIKWRGHPFVLHRGSVITPVATPKQAVAREGVVA